MMGKRNEIKKGRKAKREKKKTKREGEGSLAQEACSPIFRVRVSSFSLGL